MGIDENLSEINHLETQVKRQRADILGLRRAGIDTAAAKLLLGRMLAKLDGLFDERDRLILDTRRTYASGKAIHGTPWHAERDTRSPDDEESSGTVGTDLIIAYGANHGGPLNA